MSWCRTFPFGHDPAHRLCRADDDFNLYAYVGSDPLNKTDPTGMFESHWLLRALVPGQVTYVNAMTAAENGNYGQEPRVSACFLLEAQDLIRHPPVCD